MAVHLKKSVVAGGVVYPAGTAASPELRELIADQYWTGEDSGDTSAFVQTIADRDAKIAELQAEVAELRDQVEQLESQSKDQSDDQAGEQSDDTPAPKRRARKQAAAPGSGD